MAYTLGWWLFWAHCHVEEGGGTIGWLMSDDEFTTPAYCSLSPEDAEDRKPQIVGMLERALRVEEVEGGYRFVFPGDHEALESVVRFALAERRCCPTGSYTIEFGGVEEEVLFTFEGIEGLKDDLREGLDLERFFDDVPR